MLWDLLVGIARGWEDTCGIKVAHSTEALAQEHADRINTGARRAREPYPCVWCFHWHVGRRITLRNIGCMRRAVIEEMEGRGK